MKSQSHGQSWSAVAAASTLNPVPANGDPVFNLTLTSLKWDNHRHADGFKVYIADGDLSDERITCNQVTGAITDIRLTLLGTTGGLPTTGSQVTYTVPGAFQTLAADATYTWVLESYQRPALPGPLVFRIIFKNLHSILRPQQTTRLLCNAGKHSCRPRVTMRS